MRKILFSAKIFVLSVFILTAGDPSGIKYFKVDNIVTISGKIVKIEFEKIYSDKSSFVVFKVLNGKENKIYRVEVSPRWFYSLDIVEGGIVRITGSLNIIDKENIILLQSIVYGGEIFLFRDKLGFPLWRGMKKGFRHSFKREGRRKGRN